MYVFGILDLDLVLNGLLNLYSPVIWGGAIDQIQGLKSNTESEINHFNLENGKCMCSKMVIPITFDV